MYPKVSCLQDDRRTPVDVEVRRYDDDEWLKTAEAANENQTTPLPDPDSFIIGSNANHHYFGGQDLMVARRHFRNNHANQK